MALIVEDGTGLPLAESYISVANANAYFLARENDTWDAVDNKEAALRKATDYMQQAFSGRWLGYRATTTQTLDWPRRSVPLQDHEWVFQFIPETSVPLAVQRACAELALLSVAGPLIPKLERAQSQVTVGEISVHYDPASSELPRYPAIDMMLAPYLRGSSTMVRLERV
jgi:hypothetical protein